MAVGAVRRRSALLVLLVVLVVALAAPGRSEPGRWWRSERQSWRRSLRLRC
jgi:hypothetical protein